MSDKSNKLCPWWLGYFLVNPFRKIYQNPKKILGSYLKEGMKVMDVGCAMGFFSLPMACLVKEEGKVFCIDIQKKMLRSLEKRAQKKNLINNISLRNCNYKSLEIEDLENKIDFVLCFAVVHEVSDPKGLMKELYNVLKPKGKLLFSEPSGHVSKKDFNKSVELAQNSGFKLVKKEDIKFSRAILLEKPIK